MKTVSRPLALRTGKVATLVLIVLALFVAGGFGTFAFTKNAAKSGVEYLTHQVARGDLVVSVTEEGTLESSSNSEIKCRVKGGSTVLSVIETGTEVQPGDILIELDKSTIEENISQQKIAYETAVANLATAESDVAVATIGITEYLEGTFRSEKTTKEKEVVIAESSLKSAQNALDHTEKMFRKGYTSMLDLQAQKDAVRHAELELKVKQTDLEVLEKFTKAKQMEELESLLKIATAQLASRQASLELERARLEREEKQLANCTIRSEVAGMVIYPSAAEWKETPDIEQGASVREDQVLLMIPDLDQMQVKVGIHESKVDRLRVGMPARIELTDGDVAGKVASVSSITKPSGWWNGNMVNYDTVIELEKQAGLKPGMSVSVEIFLAKHKNVLFVPVIAVMEIDDQYYCWVETANGVEKRKVTVSDSNEQFIVIDSGLNEGDAVVLNPIDFLDEEDTGLEPLEKKAAVDVVPDVKPDTQSASDKVRRDQKVEGAAKPKLDGAAILKFADKNKDGGLTIDEVDEKSKADFAKNDTNGDGKLDAAEIDAAMKK